MSRIDATFEALRERNETALVAFLTAGDPDLDATLALATEICQSGADLLEIGVPFSDPIAEGPVIQKASERALRGGVTLRGILPVVARLRERVETPILLMGYANPFHAFGDEAFAEAAAASGVDGVIVPDLPPEEGGAFYAACEARGIDAVLLAAPTTTPERMQTLGSATRGFLYYVSLTGVTGARRSLAEGLREKVSEVRAHCARPVCVGFGVSTPEQAEEIAGYADGVVVGSAFVDRIARAKRLEAAVDAVGELAAALKAPLRKRSR